MIAGTIQTRSQKRITEKTLRMSTESDSATTSSAPVVVTTGVRDLGVVASSSADTSTSTPIMTTSTSVSTTPHNIGDHLEPAPPAPTPSPRQQAIRGSLFSTILIWMVLTYPASGYETRHQINYGTVFEEIPKLFSSSEFWTHTFIVDIMPAPSLSFVTPKCDCPQFMPIFRKLDAMQNDTNFELNQLSAEIYHNTRSTIKSSRNRNKRSLLPFIGQISKGLFGTATSDDLKRVAAHVNSIQKITVQLNQKFNHQIDTLSSFMKTSNNRMDNAFKAILGNHNELLQLESELTSAINNNQNSYIWLMTLLMDQMEYHQHIRSEYRKFSEGFHIMLTGKLSPATLDKKHFEIVLLNIANSIANRKPTFKLAHTSPSYYYKHGKFLLHRANSKLLITVRFPVIPIAQPLRLFKIHSFPVPINRSTNHATLLNNLPKYLAINADSDIYTTLHQDILQECDQDEKFTHCHFNLPVTPIAQKSCALALFDGSKSDVHSECDFKFQLNVLKPSIKVLNKTHVVLTNIANASLQCSDKPQTISCNFCLLQLPCNCGIRTSIYTLPPRFTGCHSEKTNFTILHPINLILLQKFFDSDNLKTIQPNSTFLNPLNISIKPFQFFNHEFSKVIANDKMNRLSLDKMVVAAKEDKIIYTSLAEPLIDDSFSSFDIISYQSIIPAIAILLSSICSIVMIILCKRVKHLSTMLMVSTQLKQVSANPTPPSFIYTNAPMPTQKSVISQIHETLPNINTYILLVLILVAIIYIVRKYFTAIQKPVLIVEISNASKSALCEVQHLPTCLQHCIFGAANPVSIVKVNLGIFPRVLFNWNGFSITVKGNQNKIKPKISIPVDLLNAFKIRSIISDSEPYIVQLWVKHHKYCIPVDVQCTQSMFLENTENIGS